MALSSTDKSSLFTNIISFCKHNGKINIPQPIDESPRNTAYKEATDVLKHLFSRREITTGTGSSVVMSMHGDAPTRSGSWAKRTYLPSSSDVDLVVLMSGSLTQQKFLDLQIRDSLSDILVKNLPSLSTSLGVTRNTRGGKCITLYHTNKTEIDVVFALKMNTAEPAEWYKPLSMSTAMSLSSSAVEWQVKMVRDQPFAYRESVRIAKLWRESVSFDYDCYPASFLLELLVLRCFEKVTSPFPSLPVENDLERTHRVCRLVFLEFLYFVATLGEELLTGADHHSGVAMVFWETYLKKSDICFIEMKENLNGKPAIIVVDPANPKNDVGAPLKDWTPFQQAAQQTLYQVMKMAPKKFILPPLVSSSSPKAASSKSAECTSPTFAAQQQQQHQQSQHPASPVDFSSCESTLSVDTTPNKTTTGSEACPYCKKPSTVGLSPQAAADHQMNCSKRPGAFSCRYCHKSIGSANGLQNHEETCAKK